MYRNLLAFAFMHVERLHYTCSLFIFLFPENFWYNNRVTVTGQDDDDDTKCISVNGIHSSNRSGFFFFSEPIMNSCHAHLISSCHSYKCVTPGRVWIFIFWFLLYSLWLADNKLLTYWIVERGMSMSNVPSNACCVRLHSPEQMHDCQMVFRMTLRQYYL